MAANLIDQCADAVDWADGLLVAAGAGMGVDSGLPDFRGQAGFWQAYPALGKSGITFHQIASPDTFHRDPALAWGFYGHRLKLYRDTVPHAGFALLKGFATAKPQGLFVFTSNVDGQFQKAGFPLDRICEIHGSIHHLQCLGHCAGIWPATAMKPTVDEERCRLLSEPPTCPNCGGLARPNILMFGDYGWLAERTEAQESRLMAWLHQVKRLTVIEIGAGTAIPSVRHFGEFQDSYLIRINPREAELPRGKRGTALAMGALDALTAIALALGQAPG